MEGKNRVTSHDASLVNCFIVSSAPSLFYCEERHCALSTHCPFTRQLSPHKRTLPEVECTTLSVSKRIGCALFLLNLLCSRLCQLVTSVNDLVASALRPWSAALVSATKQFRGEGSWMLYLTEFTQIPPSDLNGSQRATRRPLQIKS